MFIRIILTLAFFAFGYFLFRLIMFQVEGKRCPACNGQGYWVGTRGDRNTCKECDGSGRG